MWKQKWYDNVHMKLYFSYEYQLIHWNFGSVRSSNEFRVDTGRGSSFGTGVGLIIFRSWGQSFPQLDIFFVIQSRISSRVPISSISGNQLAHIRHKG
jgi:hypothetical protein